MALIEIDLIQIIIENELTTFRPTFVDKRHFIIHRSILGIMEILVLRRIIEENKVL